MLIIPEIIAIIAMAVAVPVGWYIKNRTEVANNAIPIITFAIQFLSQILTYSGVAIAAVAVSPALIPAISFGAFLSTLGPMVFNALFQTLFVTGAHSGTKAVQRFVRDED